jgi:hypothetical protein
MKPSCIVSFHTNPYTCGVARFNRSLADEMKVPMISVDSFASSPIGNSLISIKFDEMSPAAVKLLTKELIENDLDFNLLLHDLDGSDEELLFCSNAKKLFTAKKELQERICELRPDAVATFAPGAPAIDTQGGFDLTLITFGMAHKIRADGYKKLGDLLDKDSRKIQLEISTALHEGTSFSEEFFSINSEISAVFKGNVNFLGFLADSEVSRRINSASALIAFFPFGVRENNTTVLSAMAHGCAVITNLDTKSPPWMEHGVSVFNIDEMESFPSEIELKSVGMNAKEAVRPYSFKSLVEILES